MSPKQKISKDFCMVKVERKKRKLQSLFYRQIQFDWQDLCAGFSFTTDPILIQQSPLRPYVWSNSLSPIHTLCWVNQWALAVWISVSKDGQPWPLRQHRKKEKKKKQKEKWDTHLQCGAASSVSYWSTCSHMLWLYSWTNPPLLLPSL